MDDDDELDRLLSLYGLQSDNLDSDGEDDALPPRWDEDDWQ